ncbi:MAG: hypothetical protein NZO16_07820, partial [Deltaproteobacteria bacterium]|nr:hypothetical protein [Deltaproteobacteria bacterium]
MLININKKSSSSFSRRDFTLGLGASSLLSCADSRIETIYPHFKDPEYSIPGNSVYYASTCLECKAGCGILVEVKEGRAIKIEGNPEDPNSKGGTCALGQSSVQGLYDPNRIREPLVRVETTDKLGNPVVNFQPIHINEAMSRVATAVKNSANRFFFCSELDTFNQEIFDDFCSLLNFKSAQYEPFNHSDLQSASKEVFGIDETPVYDLGDVNLIVSFGAEFLETWLDPVKFTKQWSALRKKKKVLHYQIEPRCSLTGSKADKWICVNPHTEVLVALAILKHIVRLKGGTGLPSSLKERILNIDETGFYAKSGVSKDLIIGVAGALIQSESSVVLGGGIQSRGKNKIILESVCLLINYVLGNFGKSVNFALGVRFKSNFSNFSNLLSQLVKPEAKGAVVFIKGNFSNWIPSSFPLLDLNKLVKPGLIVYFGDILDSTS